MLRFRIKMLSKENLMAKTSDIGSCLGLLTGKLLVVGFVIASIYGSERIVTVEDAQFKGKTPYQLKAIAVEALNEHAVLSLKLQEQLAAQPAPKTPIRIKERRDTLTDAVSNPQSGVFGTPLKGTDTGAIVRALETAELTGDDARDFRILSSLFEIYIEERTPTPNSVTALAITDGGSAAWGAMVKRGEEGKPSDEPTGLNDIFNLFKRRLAGVIGPDFLAFYTKEFDVLVVARKSPLHQSAAPVLDLQKEGERYVKKIMSAIESRESLFNLVQEYRPLDEEAIEMHAMLHLMLGSNISDAATAFKPTQDVTTLIEVGDQLRDRFFNTAQLTFIHYMSGQSNKTNVREIIAITNGGRGKAISDSVLFSLNQELEQIFYPRRESGSLTVTTYAFQRPRGSGTSGREPLAIASWTFPLLSATGYLANALFGNCMRPQQGLLTNGDNGGSSSTLEIKNSDDL